MEDTKMRIECQYHGDGTREYFDHVIGLSLVNNSTLLLVFDNDETLEINRPDYVKEC